MQVDKSKMRRNIQVKRKPISRNRSQLVRTNWSGITEKHIDQTESRQPDFRCNAKIRNGKIGVIGNVDARAQKPARVIKFKTDFGIDYWFGEIQTHVGSDRRTVNNPRALRRISIRQTGIHMMRAEQAELEEMHVLVGITGLDVQFEMSRIAL